LNARGLQWLLTRQELHLLNFINRIALLAFNFRMRYPKKPELMLLLKKVGPLSRAHKSALGSPAFLETRTC
jgi:hypothetical protein